MQMWFSQYHTSNVKLDVRIQEQLFSGQSDYQKIDVFKSYEFGKMVALDGEIVFSDTDEFIYDEMVTHVPMAVHPNAKKIEFPCFMMMVCDSYAESMMNMI